MQASFIVFAVWVLGVVIGLMWPRFKAAMWPQNLNVLNAFVFDPSYDPGPLDTDEKLRAALRDRRVVTASKSNDRLQDAFDRLIQSVGWPGDLVYPVERLDGEVPVHGPGDGALAHRARLYFDTNDARIDGWHGELRRAVLFYERPDFKGLPQGRLGTSIRAEQKTTNRGAKDAGT